MEAHPDRICSFEWLKSSAVEQEVSIVVGTVLGHMSVYRIKSGEFYLQRYIPNAHFDMVTSIA